MAEADRDCNRKCEAECWKGGGAAWIVRRESQGLGYAREAAEAAHRWFESEHGAKRSVCLVDPRNRASLKLAEGLGYRVFGDAAYRDAACVMLERPGAQGVSSG